MLRTRGAFRRQGQQRKRNLSARGIIGVHDKSRVGLSTNGFALHLVPRTDEYRRAPEVHGRAEEVVSRRVEVAARVVPGHGRDDLRL